MRPARATESYDYEGVEGYGDEPVGDSEDDGVDHGVAHGSDAGVNEQDGEAESHGGSAEGEDPEEYIATVSFGALKKAQGAIARKRKRGSDTNAEQEEKLDALRSRLRQMKQAKLRENATQPTERPSKKSRPVTVATTATTQDMDSDSDSAPSEVGGSKSRTSKHAPVSKSSRFQVTRKRVVVDVPKRVARDPRFDAFNQNTSDPGNVLKAYSFLRDYQEDEIAELKAAVKQAKTEDDRETLKRKLISMQNRIKTDDAKEREQNVLRQHRKEEKERVDQGKKPFFLKRKEVKDRALVEKFKGMKGKDRDKLVERRRRKDDQREKKKMPEARRFGD